MGSQIILLDHVYRCRFFSAWCRACSALTLDEVTHRLSDVYSFPSRVLERFSKSLEKLELGFPDFAEPQGYVKLKVCALLVTFLLHISVEKLCVYICNYLIITHLYTHIVIIIIS